MKRLFVPFLILATLLVVYRTHTAAEPQQPQEQQSQEQWTRVKDAMNQGLPKTAIEELAPIIERSKAESKFDEWIHAVTLQITLESNIEGNQPVERITRLEKAIETAPPETKAVMNTLLANWYWNHFRQNRWRYQQRTQSSGGGSDDIETWDLPRILAKVDEVFTTALSDKAALQQIPIERFGEVFVPGNVSDAYRPTLFDVLAHDALEFYTAGEQGGSKSQDYFEPAAESPIFSDTADFIAWEPETTDADSPTLRAIRLYQDLLRFHESDEDVTAFADNDLSRIVLASAKAVGAEKQDRYLASLRRLIERYDDHPVSALARHYLAQQHHNNEDFVLAHEIASVAVERFADSVGGRRCHNLIQQIEAKQLEVRTERVWNGDQPELLVDYRNITEVHFRIVRFDFETHIQSSQREPHYVYNNELQELLARPFLKSWSVELPATEDYKARIETLEPPAGLPPGSYLLIASGKQDFSLDENQISVVEIWVSDLALVVRTSFNSTVVNGFVLDAQSGEPIRGATVDAWIRQRDGRSTRSMSVRTDQSGFYEFQPTPRQQLTIHARHRNQSLSSDNVISVRARRDQEELVRATKFFTDRSIYRPGQTIQYKGICHSYNQADGDYKTSPNMPVTVALFDANNQEIHRQEHRCNAYGSFSGSFTAPADQLTGRMSIRVVNGPNGQAQVSVEQYKRPQFKTELDAPEVAAKLNEPVELTGHATAYSGAPMNGATVSYRVVREVRYPGWWYWRCWWAPPLANSQEISHGTTEVGDDGTYKISFVAKPDASVPLESEPTFRYTVFADVTDTTGETRSDSKTVQVGYTALAATLSTDSWLVSDSGVPLRIATKTLDGVGQAASGEIKIHVVQQPEEVIPPRLLASNQYYRGNTEPEKPDPSVPSSWELGELVEELSFETDAGGNAELKTKPLAPGIYRALLSTEDRFGKSVSAVVQFHVFDPDAKQFSAKLPSKFLVKDTTVQPGDTLVAIWGSGYTKARAYIEIEHEGRIMRGFWTTPGQTQMKLEQPVTEDMRGGFTVRMTMVHDNRIHEHSQRIPVEWNNKKLSVSWEHMVSKLEPGSKETWTATVTGPDAENRFAEMVATLYDASLDAYQSHTWSSTFGVFYQDHTRIRLMFANSSKNFHRVHQTWGQQYLDPALTYRHFLPELTYNYHGFQMARMRRGGFSTGAPMPMAAAEGMMDGEAASAPMDGVALYSSVAPMAKATAEQASGQQDASQPDLNQVALRKNLNETAFFFPHLLSDKDGQVKLEFEMPEALTEWKFMGFAHDNDLSAGLLTGSTVTQKDIMVQPNPPRFLRDGDQLEFTVKVSNLSPTRQTGTVRLSFLDARTEESIDDQIANRDSDQDFAIPAGSSETFSWKISIPDGTPWLIYRAVASTGKLSDGQQDFLPVLSRRVLVTESMQLPIRGQQTKQFEFDKLRDSGNSDSLTHQSLTVQMASNPSWYAVMALPYLMEYPYECNEQTFNRMYANSLAQHIAGSDARIENVFAQWRGTKALDSPLEKNAELKSVMLQETPWLSDGKDESAARRNVGILFEKNRLASELKSQLKKLTENQLPGGGWSWFPGGRENEFITLYITTGFGRLRHLGTDVDVSAAVKALAFLDAEMTERYTRIDEGNRKDNQLSPHVAFYLYGRTFFLKDHPIDDSNRVAFDYWKSQAQKYWLDLNNRQSQAHIAVALKRLGDAPTANAIMRSIDERSVSDEEMGMYWRDTERSWWWYRAPIETQAMMIEAFDEVADDAESVEACKVWLLKQKQTRDWKTTKATADAVYALLLRGTDLLRSTELVMVELAGEAVQPESVEAGTGYYEQKFLAGDISAEQSQVTVIKKDPGVAWGSVHWQYLENIDKVTTHSDGPLSLTKEYSIKRNTADGPKLIPITENESPQVGDELVARIVVKTDRDMEYVHLRDQRGSGTEPVNVLSGYRFQDGLAYYESTQDTASHYFIDYLPKGTYVFEYSVRVQHRGQYQTGLASIQCMYAPEFNSHSESVELRVR
ncbi:alpha-2-macroglobulin family protein [Stieleria varia]|uniref:MG2 domain protein n=1 Tax=Stieleria varia TaxID=2528005 RepID=A0A5C6B684_9BACT|nr:MG2 domain-containing protein [Stieleria varia]TWU07563.1 MG2 domain protein [Stieleria varia]